MSDSPHRRRFERRALSHPVLVERITEEPVGAFGLTRDLSPGGCGLHAAAPIGLGSRVKLYLSIGSEVLEAEGMVVHQRAKPDGSHDLGVEILRMEQPHRARYNLLLAAPSFQ